MGKSKQKKKNKSHGHNPTGLPSVRDITEEETEEGIENGSSSFMDETTIQTVIEQVQALDVEDKICGLQVLATAFTDKDAVEELINKKIIKIVAPLLLDQNSEIRNFTAGALRNLSACGSVDVCEHLVKEDIMTPLIALIQQYGDWRPDQNKPSQENENTDTLVQAVNLLWNLCEVNETAVKYFNSAQLLNVLLGYLDFDVFGIDLAVVVCQCLHTVSEDNPAAITVLRNFETQLLAILALERNSAKLLQLQTLVAGLIVNCSPSSNWLMSVLTTLSHALNSDYRTRLSHLSSQVPLQQTAVPLDKVTETQIEDCSALLDAHITALEILTNVCSSQDDEMEQDSDDTMSDEVEQYEDEWTDADVTQPLVLSAELHEAVIKLNILQSTYENTGLPPENVCDILRNCTETKGLMKKVSKLQCRAYLCFSNIVPVLDIADLGGSDHLYSTWTNIGKLILENKEDEFIEAATSAMRAILLRLASVNYGQLGALSISDLEILLQVGIDSNEPRVRGNIIRIIGTLGLLFANSNSLEMTKVVGVFLMAVVEKEAELWLLAETLDAIMDVFAEDSTDLAASEIDLVPKLKSLAPLLKRKLRQERKKQPEHYAIVSTAAMNLGRFITYKGARIDKLEKEVS